MLRVVEIREIEKAAEDFEYVDCAHKLFSIGTLYHADGNVDKAKAWYLKSLEENSDFQLAKYNLAKAYMKGGEYDKARKFLEDIIQMQPDVIETAILYGDVLMDLGEYQKADKVYREVLEREEMNEYSKISYVYHNTGLNLYRMGEIEESITFFSKALDSITNVTAALFSGIVVNLAKTYYKAGRVQKAQETLQWGIKKDSHEAAFYAVLGTIYYAEGNLDCAEEELEKALAIDPRNALALDQREQVSKAKGDQDE